MKWADGVLAGAIKVKRPNEPGKIERAVKWDVAIGIAEKTLKSRIGKVAQSPVPRRSALLKAAKNTDKKTGFAAEDEALADLISGDQFRACIYAFNLVQKRAKRPAGAPDKALAKKVTKVGVIGAGLMASQFALLFVRRLQVPVVITDLDQARVDKGLDYIHDRDRRARWARAASTPDEANRLKALVTGTTDKADFADCDWVIEAVFEELGVKQDVFADVEQYISPEAILATNTSSLSVEQIGAKLKHPERLVGFHFFNPVAVMPLIEVVKTRRPTDVALSTAMVDRRRSCARTRSSRPTPPDSWSTASWPRCSARRCTPSSRARPFERGRRPCSRSACRWTRSSCSNWSACTVGAHVLDTHHAAFPDRFFESAALHELAESRSHLREGRQGQGQGLRPEGRSRSSRSTASPARTRCSRGRAAHRGSRTAWPTRSTGCWRTASSPRPRTSTSA